MQTATIQKKLMFLETELRLVKEAIQARPDFRLDRKNWAKVRPVARKARRALYKETYGA